MRWMATAVWATCAVAGLTLVWLSGHLLNNDLADIHANRQPPSWWYSFAVLAVGWLLVTAALLALLVNARRRLTAGLAIAAVVIWTLLGILMVVGSWMSGFLATFPGPS